MTNIIYIYIYIYIYMTIIKLYKRKVKESQEKKKVPGRRVVPQTEPPLKLKLPSLFLFFFVFPLLFSSSLFFFSQNFSLKFLTLSFLSSRTLPSPPFFFSSSTQFGSPLSFSNLLLLFILSFGSFFFYFFTIH